MRSPRLVPYWSVHETLGVDARMAPVKMRRRRIRLSRAGAWSCGRCHPATCAALGSTDVEGSDPPVRGPGTGSEAGVFAHLPPPSWGRSRIRYPCRKAVQRRCGAADRQFYRPSSRCVCATAEDRARTRGERQTVGCRERRAMSRRFGSPETLGCGKAPIRESPARSLPRS